MTDTPQDDGLVERLIAAVLTNVNAEGYTIRADEMKAAVRTHIAALRAENEALREVVGAHIQADAYRDTMPDDDADGRSLRKSEMWWRLTARSWLTEQLADDCAAAAKARVVASPEHQRVIAEVRASLTAKGRAMQ